MKANFYLITLLLTGLVISSCEKEDFHYEDAFDTSYRTWLDFKETSKNSYQYMVTGGTWAGSSWRTIITVENGTVTRRQFMYDVFHDIVAPSGGWGQAQIRDILDLMGLTGEEFAEMNGRSLAEELSWVEEGDEVGTRGPAAAAPPRTLDEIYEAARKVWLIKRDDAKTYFEANNDGLLSSCGFVMNGCQDDCFNGITITFIKKLQ
ncbi:hypothetical protein EDD80_11653 [Anseongella ginsenosidimutans]|uniref:Uncharacterized protein n=1 Tax=Anseongella ginsenosidimutans TaxID=496056 RepID=A0A4R3KLK1_9SPHI|nr:hypothetical protein [Anseongella ginsenosidimutans]QEC53815.1 hypothetical protein FRZ59_16730 [Anseongella ginsenosidimutans]TCS84961.1 hypothetical protein EDD80_11653 [Anseongella ginsenosidimutans]